MDPADERIFYRAIERLEEQSQRIDRVEKSYDSIRGLIIELQISSARVSEYTNKIKDLDTELRDVKDRLISYELKFRALDDLKAMVFGLTVTMLPLAIQAVVSIVKFLIEHKMF